ncbi:MAG: Ig-like domain-containing protein [Muribaculaceae bacterium]|nr:Ig-like domain-containing protein [Muribaculaceae bacterium]
MKKLFTFLVGAVIGLGAYAQDFDSGGLTYSVLSPDDKTCAVTGFNENELGSVLEIPDMVSYEGVEYTVTEIEDYAFRYCGGINNVIFPSSLEVIGYRSFWNCNGFNEIVIPNSVKEIGVESFGACYGLNRVELGSSVETINSRAFSECPLNVVVALGEIPAQFTQGYLDAITSNPLVAVKENAIAAYQAAWEGANVVPNISAESLTFEPSRYTVQPGGTVQLNCVAVPADAPFSFINRYQGTISVDENGLVTADNLQGGFGVVVEAISLNGLTATCNIEIAFLDEFTLDGFVYTVIPNATNEVGLMRYESNSSVVKIPETVEYNGNTYSVTVIGQSAFHGNENIEEVVIPASVNQIRKYNFYNCSSLKKVRIEDSSTPLELSDDNFNEVNNLSELYVGRNLIRPEIASCFGWGIERLSQIVLGPEVTSVQDYLFQSCHNLSLVESKNPVPPTLGDRAFGYNYSLTIIVPAESIEAYRSAWEQYAEYIIDTVDADDISIDIDEVTLYNGQSIQLPLTVEPEGATVIWTSSNPNIASVDNYGNVSYGFWTNEVGEATITASTLNGLTAECKVVSKHWLTFSEDNVALTPGSDYPVVVTKPEEIAESIITWASSDESVATVDENGLITAHSFGEVEITATVDVPYNDWLEPRTYSIKVKVNSEIISVEAVDPVITVWKENTAPIHLIFNPDDEHIDREIIWTVADTKVAEVYQSWDGLYYVRALNAGTTTITGTTVNGKTVEIEVVVKAEVNDIILAKETILLTLGETAPLEFTTVPEETNQTFKYRSFDENVVTVDENGVITAHNYGSTQIEIWYETPWGENVWWRRQNVQVGIMPESVRLVGSSDYEGSANQWIRLQIEFTPDNQNVFKQINWTVDNPEVGYIDSYNEFWGENFGTTAFRGVAANGDVLEGTISIAGIKMLVDGVETRDKEVVLGSEFKLDVKASSENLLENLRFYSDNPEVAAVTEDGTVTAVGYGRTQVRAITSVEGKNYEAYVYVTVAPSEGFEFDKQHVTLAPYNYQIISIIRSAYLPWSYITWSSSNEAVVRIDWGDYYDARISYVGPGTATVTATDEYGNMATCEVTCLGNIDNVYFNTNKIYVAPGETFQLEWITQPAGSEQDLRFESANESIATVDPQTGLVTGVELGFTYIYAIAQNGRTWYIPVRVCKLPESVKFAGSSNYTGVVNDYTWFEIEYTPNDNDIFKEIEWSVENPEIGYIVSNYDNKYGFIGKNIGTTAFRGVAANGDVLEGTITIEGISFVDPPKEVEIGSEIQLEVVASENIPQNMVYTYTSSNTEVATVSEDGVVTTVGPGVATITVKAEVRQNGRRNMPDGRNFVKAVTEVRENDQQSFEANFTITVLPSEGMIFDNDKLIIFPNSYPWLSIIRAKNVELSEVTWRSSNEDVVAIGYNDPTRAQLMYIGKGTAEVTATDAFGNVATCEVTCVGNIDNVVFNTEKIFVDPGKTFQLKYTIEPEGTGQTLTFASDDEAVATVDPETGLVTGVKEGETLIRAIAQNGWTWPVPVVVCNVPKSVKLVGSTDYKGVINDYTPLQIKYTPNDDKVYRKIQWTLDDPEVGYITELENETTHEMEYVFYGKKLGTTAFTGVAANGDVLKGTFTNGLVFDKEDVILVPGNMEYVTVERFSGINWAELTWESSDENVVTVLMGTGNSATLNYKGAGNAVVTVTDRNGYSAICNVIGTGIILNESEMKMPTNSPLTNVEYKLVADVLPINAEASTILWRSENPDLVMAAGVGRECKLISKGQTGVTKVYATTYVNGYYTEAVCEVTVYEYVPVTNVTPDISTITAEVDTKVQLTATVSPEDASDKDLVWESSDVDVATVDEDGLVTIHSEGTAVITAHSVDNPLIFATFYVTGVAGDGVEGIDGDEATFDVYNMNGILVKKGATADDYEQLERGIYLIKKGDKVVKVKH